VKYSLDVTPGQGYAEFLRSAPEITKAELGSGLDEAAALFTREVKEATPVGVTGLLRQSITNERRDEGDELAARIFSPLVYAAPVELGTKPHYPPIEPLQDWVRKKLDVTEEEDVQRVARLIQWKIGRKGTRARNMFGSTLGRLTPQMSEIVRRAYARLVDRLSEGR